MAKVEVKCKSCNKKFLKSRAELKRYPVSYCSRKCQNKASIKRNQYLICKKCGKEFSIKPIIDGKKLSLGNRKYCLECSPLGSRNTRKLEKPKIPDRKVCPKCNKGKPANEFYVRGRGDLYSYCKECANKKVTAERKEKGIDSKKKLIAMKGGGCEVCGYNKNLAALCFHHKDPKTKSFSIDARMLISTKWNKILKEANKCMLLCANCHAETHNPHLAL